MRTIRRAVIRSRRAQRYAALGKEPKGYYSDVLRHRLRAAREEPKAQGNQHTHSWVQVFTQNRPADVLPDLSSFPEVDLDFGDDDPTEVICRQVMEDDPTEEYEYGAPLALLEC